MGEPTYISRSEDGLRKYVNWFSPSTVESRKIKLKLSSLTTNVFSPLSEEFSQF